MEDSASLESARAQLEAAAEQAPNNSIIPSTESGAASATPDAGFSKLPSPPARRKREYKERTRVSRACDRCKQKKTRCTGRCPCTLCLRSDKTCEFTASYTRGRLPSVVVDESALLLSRRQRVSLSEQIRSGNTSQQETSEKTLDALSFQLPSVRVPLNANASCLGRTDNLHAENNTRELPSRVSPEPARGQTDQQGHYIGSSSAVAFLIRIQKRLHQNSSLSHESSIFTFGDAPLPEFDPSFFVLPPKPEAQRLVERYFDFAAPTHRFLHRPTIEKLVNEFYETQGDLRSPEDAPAKKALLLIVFAQAQAYMPMNSKVKDNSARYFFAAEHQLEKERGAVRLISVQARLLQCFYLLTQSRINHCWSLFGTLSHLALAIGLHRSKKCDPPGTIDYVELESRRRLFWCAYCLDKYLASALGRPRTFKDEDIDQELPTIVNDSDLHPHSITPTPTSTFSFMTAPVEHIKLTRIVSLVLRDLYPIRPPSLAHRVDLSAKYTSDVKQWRASLSQFLSSDETPALDPHSRILPIYQRQRSVLNLSYHHTLLLIHRPFLLSSFANLNHMSTHSSFANASIDTGTHIAACLDAAMSIVRVVDDVFTSSNLFRSFWFTQYYAFCAVVVLYIYRIQAHIVTPGKCEGYFRAGGKCQRQLESVSETDCLARRYWLVLEELRLEAVRRKGGVGDDGKAYGEAMEEGVVSATPSFQADPATFFGAGADVTIAPESAAFVGNGFFDNSLMADLTSWGQFDSLVTAGFGMFDGAGLQGEGDFGAGFAFGL